jgi:hypothetical protein
MSILGLAVEIPQFINLDGWFYYNVVFVSKRLINSGSIEVEEIIHYGVPFLFFLINELLFF